MRKFDWFTSQSQDLYDRDKELRRAQRAYDRMSRVEYELPESLKNLQWMRTVRSTGPYNALRGGTRALSSLDERLKIEPVSALGALERGTLPDSLAARNKANEWEKALKWAMDLAATRQSIFRSDVIRAALLYDEIVAQVVHLPTQIRAIEGLGGDAKRQKAAARYGPFAVLIRNPQQVHVRYSDYMPEAALFVKTMTAQEVVDSWGERAAKIRQLIDDEDAPDNYVLFDYCDYEGRCVWAVPGDEEEAALSVESDSDDVVKILEPEKNPYPFLAGWIAVKGGTGLDGAPQHQRLPLLYPIYRAEQWINANIVGSLVASEAIAEMGQPKVKASGPNTEDGVQASFGEPGGRWEVKPGHDVLDMQDRGLDPALADLAQRFESEIERATVSRILVTAEAQAGESFSGYNLRVQTAIGSLMPYKELGERWYAEAYKQMLLWVHYTGGELSGHDVDRRAQGKIYTIDSGDIDPERLYLRVELTPDVPVDRLQKINAATLLAKLNYPVTMILEELGVTDPEGALRQWRMEQYTLAAHAGKLQLIQAQTSGLIEQLAAQKAAGQLQAATRAASSPQPAPPEQVGPMGMPGIGGEGFAPPMGGIPPAMANPAMNVREQQNGRSRLGDELAGGIMG